MKRLPLSLVAAVAVIGCSHNKPPVAAVPMAPPAPAISKATEPAANPATVPVSPNVAVASDVAQRCSLHFNSTPKAPKFDFDRFELLPQDRDVLEQVATCLTTGPLQGHTVQLVGRADPRGNEEYNLGLGTQRADSVRAYLQRLGVSTRQLSETTRGALDATGTDEAGWQVDRRVDLQLAAR